MRRNRVLALAMVGLFLLTTLLSACSKENAAPTGTDKPDTAKPAASVPKVFSATGQWDLPPAYHGNRFVTGGENNPWWWVSEPLFVYVPTTGEILPRLGLEWKEEGNKVTVPLRKGVTWHDGTPFTAKDVVANFYLMKLLNRTIWRFLDNVQAPDDNTVVFNFKVFTPFAKQIINNDPIWAGHKWYSKWSDQVPGVITDTAALAKIREDLNTYKPAQPIGMGPFVFKSVSASEMVLEKNPKHYAADKIAFDTLKLARGNSNESIWAMNLAGELDVCHAAAPKDLVEQFLKRQPKEKMATPSDLSDFGLLFNMRDFPFSEQKFRQAIAFLLDRKKIREVTNYFGADVLDYSHGIIKSYEKTWLSDAALKSMTNYTQDKAKAEALLTALGLKKNEKNVWLDKSGKAFSFEIIFPSGWGLNAESVASQMTAFGLPTKARAIEDSLFTGTLNGGTYQMAVEFGQLWWGNPHPYTGYRRYFDTVADGFISKGSGMPRVVKGADGKDMDLEALVIELSTTADLAKQKAIVEKLAWASNEYLPVLTLTEKRITIYYQDGLRVTGWPAKDDPMWQIAGGGTDKLYSTLIIGGTLKPVN